MKHDIATRAKAVDLLLHEAPDILPLPRSIDLRSDTFHDEDGVRLHMSAPGDVAAWAQEYGAVTRLADHRNYVECYACWDYDGVLVTAWADLSHSVAFDIVRASIPATGVQVDPGALTAPVSVTAAG